MATYTITATQNIDELTAKAGGDTYNINGGVLNIDQDTRVGINATTSTTLGPITVSATLGGTLNIDGSLVRLIPYNSGSGNVPAWNTVISQGGASGKLIGVYASLTSASTATGAAMPASGYIKIKQWNSTAYSSGALTGISASATGPDVVGWLEIVGDEASTINANRLGTVNITGAWFELGTTSGASNQTLQIPNNGLLRYAAGVYIETAVGSGVYEFWPNQGINTTTGTEAVRGKVVWVDNTGLVRIGNSGAATNGYTPVSGLKVRIGNVFLENCTTAARTANVIPNATIATRYDFTTTGGGVVNMSKVNSAWYLSFAQPYSVTLTDVGAIDSILLSECATPITWTRVGVGNKPTTALLTNPLVMSLCFAGGTLTDCVWLRASHAASGAYTNSLTDVAGFTFVRDKVMAGVIRANATTGSWTITRAANCTWTNPTIIQGQMFFAQSTNITITDTIYVDAISGNTVTTYAMYVWQLSAACSTFVISGLTLPVTNNQPYTALLLVAAAGCSNVKFRSVGTRAAPLNLGSTNNTGLIYQLATGAAASNVKVQRVYCSNTRTGIMTGDNSSTIVTNEHVFGDYADAADVSAVLNFTQKGLGTTKALTAQTSVYGTHWVDYFTSTTAGRIAILMNEPTSLTSAYVTLSGGAAFTSAGGLYMPTVGQYAIFETPYYIQGHTSFQNSALVMAGGTVGNYRFEYSIDKNDGNGYSTMTSSSYTAAALATALNGLTGIDAQLGFKLKIKITTTTTNSTAITSVYLLTNSTTTAQDYQYPLDTNTLTLTGLVSGTDIVILSAGTETVITSKDANAGSTYAYTYSGAQNIDIGLIKQGYVTLYVRNLSLTTTDSSLPVAQIADRNYNNP